MAMAEVQLPDDALMEILSKLPVKSLLRFRSVCKNWCSLIQNPRFVALHHNRTKCHNYNNESLVVVRSILSDDQQQQEQNIKLLDSEIVLSFLSPRETLTPIVDIDLDTFLPSSEMKRVSHYGDLRVYGPCNGVVCIADHDDIVLCNPATREFKTLPRSPFSNPKGLLSRCGALGFGFDPNSNDFKVVRIVQFFDDDPYGYYCPYPEKVEIYNLSTDSWREPDIVVPSSVYNFHSFETLFNGAFHWYACHVTTESILAFDIQEEVFRQIQFPDCCSDEDGKARSLSVLNDSLALILYVDYEPLEVENYFEIWVMNEYGVKESWTKLFTVGPLLGIILPLTFWKENEFLLESSSGQLVSCDLHTQEIKEFQVFGVPASLRVLLYAEGLVSIKKRQLDWQTG